MGNAVMQVTTEKARNMGNNVQMNSIPKVREEVSE